MVLLDENFTFSLGDVLDPYADYTRSDLNEFLRSFDPDSLSSEQVYSNLGFGLLGSIAADAARIRVTFATPAESSSPSIEFVQAGQTINAPRVEDGLGTTEREEIPLDSAVLNDYQGEYELAEGVAIKVSVRDSQLFIQVTGQQAFPAFAMDTDRFFLRVVDAEIEFLRDDGGYVHELILYQAGEHRARRLGERL